MQNYKQFIMSLCISAQQLSWEKREQFQKDLKIKIENKYAKQAPARFIFPFTLVNDNVYMPFAYAVCKMKIKRPQRALFPAMHATFKGSLRDEQKVVRKEAISTMNSHGTVMICAYPGFGKTCCAINIATVIAMKTLIVVNKLVLIKQWEDSIKKFCPEARVQKLTPKSKIDSNADFYIMNSLNIEKMPSGFFKTIGLLVVDEAHMIMAESLSRSMQHIHPRYVLALTATPYRPDGLNILLELYFGKNRIIRKLVRKHTVYKVETGFKPVLEKMANGRLNWNAVLESQAQDHERNEIILNILSKFTSRFFLVLVKRVSQGEYLVEQLKHRGESVTSLLGSQQEFDRNARILVGTAQKVGVGFDHPKMDSLLPAADLQEYFIQFLGRVFRREDVEPLIFDLVDANKILEKHYASRRKVYLEHGGKIQETCSSSFI